MRKTLLVVVLAVLCVGLLAQATPYGSARVGYWYAMYDKNHVLGERTMMDYNLQANSRFGVDWRSSNVTGKVEFGAGPSLRLLWGRRDFGNWSLTVGQDAVAFNRANQVFVFRNANGTFDPDFGLNGFGAIDGGRHPQIRADFNMGGDRLYVALIRPNTVNAPWGQEGIDALIPTVQVGYDVNHIDFRLMPMVMYQRYEYNSDFRKDDDFDCRVTAYVIALTAEATKNDFLFRFHMNYGQNLGNMGFAGPNNLSVANRTTGNVSQVKSLGGYVMVGYDVNPNLNINTGFGYTVSESCFCISHLQHGDDRMGTYLQATFRLGSGFRITPEIGWLSEMRDMNDVKQGSLVYFGTQLRFDFR